MEKIRKAAVAGTFYSDNAHELRDDVQSYLQQEAVSKRFPKAVIVPHAGYIYSGKTAGKVFALLKEAVSLISTVVLIGPAHRVPVAGIAVSEATCFETPLGVLRVNMEALHRVMELPYVYISEEAHLLEHCLEVQLPFIQELFGKVSIVPLLAGMLEPEKVAEIFEILRDEKTLIVVSSDLSHFLDYESATRVDTNTSEAIQNLAYQQIQAQGACGAIPIKGLLYYAKRHGFEVELVELTNSGEASGDYDRVVGYGGYAFFESEPPCV